MIQKISAVYVILFQNEVERSIASLKERNSELEEALTKLKTQDSNFDVDEAVVTTAVIYKQLSFFTQSSLMRLVIRLTFIFNLGCSTLMPKKLQQRILSTIWEKDYVVESSNWMFS